MNLWDLRRVARTSNETFGVMVRNEVPLCVTLEPEWWFNEKNRSCIPPGTYLCTPVTSPNYGKTWEIVVPGRELVRFHWGNRDDQTRACPLLARRYSGERHGLDVLESKLAIEQFRGAQPWEEFELRVSDP